MTTDNYNVNTNAIFFEWEESKSRRNEKKHKLSFPEAKAAFSDVNALLIHDPDHSDDENRFVLMGFDAKLGLLVVSHVYREGDRIVRIISARRASRTEEHQYWQRWRR
jgi:uncharacterized protein